MASSDHETVVKLSIEEPREKYLEDDDKLHKKLITACEIATESDEDIIVDEFADELERRENFSFA